MKKLMFIFIISAIFTMFAFGEEKIIIAKNGKTDYQIVTDDFRPQGIYNANFLAWFLKEKTGAEFPVVNELHMNPKSPSIFIGTSAPVRKLAGYNIYAGLQDQEHVVKNIGNDILLYGKGDRGDFYAIMDFLDKEFGIRWYQRDVVPEIKKEKDLTLSPFSRKTSWDIKTRVGFYPFKFSDFCQGLNLPLANPNQILSQYVLADKKIKISLDNTYLNPYFIQLPILASFTHSCHRYFPRNGKKAKWFEWVENSDYFKTNPSFFSMDKNGVRVANHQMCFSNKAFRKEFTKQLERHLEILNRKDVYLGVNYDDIPKYLCCCKKCEELAKKYGTPGGAYFEYLMELGKYFKEKHPETTIVALAYRRSQTQTPPKFNGKKFTDNILFLFAPVDDFTNRTWDHPHNVESYKEMEEWTKLTNRLVVWTYYPQFKHMGFLPYSGLNILVSNFKKIKKLGVSGYLFEFYPAASPFKRYVNFSDLMIYMYYRLSKNVDMNVAETVHDYMDFIYGPASQLAEKYFYELEAASTTDNKYNLRLGNFIWDENLSYLSPERLYRWERMFDKMEELVSENKKEFIDNVSYLRKSLDCAVYGRWSELNKKYPEYFKDHNLIRQRIGQPVKGHWGEGLRRYLQEAEFSIKFAGRGKPVPQQFAKIDSNMIVRKIPRNTRRGSKIPRVIEDPNAAFGYAATISSPDLPFHLGFYERNNKRHGKRLTIEESDISPGKYKLFHLGKIQPTPDSEIWFSARSWCTSLKTGFLYDLRETDAKYDVWVSLKFPKNYKGKDSDIVLCDQVIFIKL